MKRKGAKHFKTYRVAPHVPLYVHQLERHETAKKDNETSLNDSTKKQVPAKTEVSSVTLDLENDDIIIMADDITHLLSDSIGKKLVHSSHQIYSVLEEITNSVQDKSANFFEITSMQMITSNALASDINNELEFSDNHRSNLTRNFASFGLTADLVSGDGDCVFSSIVR